MGVSLTEQQSDLIKKIAKENGFIEHEVIANSGTEKGDNFMGVLTSLTIKNGDNKLELYLKSAFSNEGIRNAIPMRKAYLREIQIYEKCFREFKIYQDDHNIVDPFSSYAKLYGASSEDKNEILIMENLKTDQYRLWDKKVPMNPGHVSAVLKEYAKFHAVSIAMNHKNPKLFAELTKDFSGMLWEATDNPHDGEEIMKKFITDSTTECLKIVKDSSDLQEFLKNNEPKIMKLFSKNKEPEFKQALTHSDCWCNNFMFKYQDDNDNTNPSNIKILDWQLSYVSSPATDFVAFFLINSSKDILNDYKTYLKLYYDTLSTQLRNFQCDPDEVFSYSTFEAHINHFMPSGLLTASMMLKVMLCESEDAPNFAEFEGEMEDFGKQMNVDIKNIDEYNRRILDIIVFLKENDF